MVACFILSECSPTRQNILKLQFFGGRMEAYNFDSDITLSATPGLRIRFSSQLYKVKSSIKNLNSCQSHAHVMTVKTLGEF